MPSGSKMWRRSTDASGSPSMRAISNPQQVGSAAIVHGAPGLSDERQVREPRDPVIRRHVAVDIAAQRLTVGGGDRSLMEVGVSQARTMGQQVFERDGAVQRVC